MNRLDHRLLGGAWGVGVGLLVDAAGGGGPAVVVGCGAVAALTAGGPLSPDVDQLWRDRTVQQQVRVGWIRWDLGRRRVRAPLVYRAARVCWRGFAWAVSRHPRWRPGAGRHGDPTQHRGITHFWGAAAAAAAVLAAAQLVLWVAGVNVPTWPAWAAWTGWCSHLAGDLVHGRQVWGQDGHGVPLAPWWGHRGVGWRSDGRAAHVVAFVLAVVAGAVLVRAVAGSW